MLHIGIDLGKYKSAVAVLDEHAKICEPTPFYCKMLELSEKIIKLAGKDNLLVGIDAPLNLPKKGNSRECEKKLLRQGISVYPAGAEFFKEVTQSGMMLRNRLANSTIQIVEIYPYASRKRLNIMRPGKD